MGSCWAAVDTAMKRIVIAGGVIQNEEALLLQTPASLFKRFRLDVRVDSEAINLDGGYMTWSNSPASKSLQLTN